MSALTNESSYIGQSVENSGIKSQRTLKNHGNSWGEIDEFDGEALLHAGIVRTPEQLEEFRRRRQEKLCYCCGGKNHVGKDCTNPEDLNPPKGIPEGNSTCAKKDSD